MALGTSKVVWNPLMYINFWYAADWSHNLGATPRKVRMLGHDIVLFRDSQGRAHALSDTCIHRGASLAGGKVRGDCLACPYHGWRFDASGHVKRIPSLGPNHESRIPQRARIDAYPVEERYGLVHVFLGDLPAAERPPIIEVPEYGKEGWRHTTLDYQWESNYERNVENGLDPAHNEFVHPTHGYSGEKDDYKVGDPAIEHTPWGFGFMLTFQAPPAKNWIMRMARNYDGDLEAGSGHVGPNNLWTKIHITPTRWIHQYLFETPIDEHHTQIFLICMRNTLLPKWIDKTVNKRNKYIAEQDRVVIEKLKPVKTPPSRARELLMPGDKVIGLYRDSLDDWTRRGWRIDTAALRNAQADSDTMFAIPSPARRETKGWVLEPVPLIPPAPVETGDTRIRAAVSAQR
jgi:phenylpropionate dioxygenase-like ring-hydroxylating dioxygenase large terminal subunit